jgi:hypothetical protein
MGSGKIGECGVVDVGGHGVDDDNVEGPLVVFDVDVEGVSVDVDVEGVVVAVFLQVQTEIRSVKS